MKTTMLKRKDFTVITIEVDNCDGGFSKLQGILISKNERWLYFWLINDFRIDGRVLVRRSQTRSGLNYQKQKMSKLQYRVMKTMGEFDKIDIEPEIKLPKSERKMLKRLVDETSTVISQETGDRIGDIEKIGKNIITYSEFTPKGKTRFGQRVYIEDVFMLHINAEKALTYSLFSK